MLQKRLRRRFMIVFSILQQQSDVVAVPHGTKKAVKNSVILIIKLDHTITWDDQLVDLVFFAAIGEDISTEYSKIFRRIVRIVSDDEQTHMLKSCNSLEEIRKYLFDTEQKA